MGSTRVTTVRPGRRRRYYIKYNPSLVGSKRLRGGWGAPARWLEEGGSMGSDSHHERAIQELGDRSASAPQ
eukprot:2266011-Pleurochrysis_carterae.AAC.1